MKSTAGRTTRGWARARVGLGVALATAPLLACHQDRPLFVIQGPSSEDAGATEEAGAVDASGPLTIRVRTTAGVQRPISVDIYGYHFPDGAGGASERCSCRPSLLRAPGFRVSTLNWENGACNGGTSWCSENSAFFASTEQPGDAITRQLDKALGIGAHLILTIPIGDYVAADRLGSSSPQDGCDGDVANSGPDYKDKRFRRNGPTKPTAITFPPDATDGWVYQDEFLSWLKAVPGVGAAGVVIELDFLPSRWDGIFKALYEGNHITYSDLCERNETYAQAVKRVWPEMRVAGPSADGWDGLMNLLGAPDAKTDGRFVDHYLDCMAKASAVAGRRLIDIFNLNWTPGAGAEVDESRLAEDVVKQRLQAPRSLWDDTYTEKSRLVDNFTHGPVRLVPWLRELIGSKLPGTDIAFSQYGFGATGDISGGLAVADALGAFGRLGVSYAVLYWPQGQSQAYSLGALQLYRNYDGNGGHFGDVSVDAQSSNRDLSTAWAAIDSGSKQRLTLVVLNKDLTSEQDALIQLDDPSFTRAEVYTLTKTASGPRAVTGAPAVVEPVRVGGDAGAALVTPAESMGAGWFRYRMPPLSASLLVFSP